MKCQNCGKNDANFKYTEVTNGLKKELNLCEECARKLGLDNFSFNIPIDFSSFFGDFLNEYEDTDFMPMLTKTNQLKCDMCNMTYDEFMNTGKFGCANCYNVFAEKIEPVLKRLHGNTNYIGRRAKDNSHIEKIEIDAQNSELEELKKRLKLTIKEENYEEAAVLRDKIKQIEGD